MKDDECVRFLQWALPRLHMRWSGFRKIRTRVCKRLQRRVKELQLATVAEYSDYLEQHAEEWGRLDEICQVTITRFYRDKMVFGFLEQTVLPALCKQVLSQGRQELNVWSVGCASGEEPYTLALAWELCLKAQFPQLTLHILATDTKPELLARAERACYSFSSVKNLPLNWRQQAFHESNGEYCLDPAYKSGVTFQCQDIRYAFPDRCFDLVLCRNLAFTYYDEGLQTTVAEKLLTAIQTAGALVIGVHETLPPGCTGMEEWSSRLGVYRKYLHIVND
jgi:chemotaxis protein methyltransferase CheR